MCVSESSVPFRLLGTETKIILLASFALKAQPRSSALLLSAIHSKNLVAIVYLLVALAMHFQAPIRLPEHVSVQVVVVKVKTGFFFCQMDSK